METILDRTKRCEGLSIPASVALDFNNDMADTAFTIEALCRIGIENIYYCTSYSDYNARLIRNAYSINPYAKVSCIRDLRDEFNTGELTKVEWLITSNVNVVNVFKVEAKYVIFIRNDEDKIYFFPSFDEWKIFAIRKARDTFNSYRMCYDEMAVVAAIMCSDYIGKTRSFYVRYQKDVIPFVIADMMMKINEDNNQLLAKPFPPSVTLHSFYKAACIWKEEMGISEDGYLFSDMEIIKHIMTNDSNIVFEVMEASYSERPTNRELFIEAAEYEQREEAAEQIANNSSAAVSESEGTEGTNGMNPWSNATDTFNDTNAENDVEEVDVEEVDIDAEEDIGI